MMSNVAQDILVSLKLFLQLDFETLRFRDSLSRLGDSVKLLELFFT